MEVENIQRALQQAKKFAEAADAVLKNSIGEITSETSFKKILRYVHPGKLSGNLRRQSMELTRALAEMRKS